MKAILIILGLLFCIIIAGWVFFAKKTGLLDDIYSIEDALRKEREDEITSEKLSETIRRIRERR